MIILNQRYYGSIARCNKCGAILGYNPEDIHSNSYIYCPICQFEIKTPMILNYDGIIKENENGSTDVSKQSGSAAADSELPHDGGSKPGDSEVSGGT